MKYRKKPVVIDAVEWKVTSESFDEIRAMGTDRHVIWHTVHGTLSIPTLEGNMTAKRGDMIIKGVRGELYPCKPDIFEQTYEPVEE